MRAIGATAALLALLVPAALAGGGQQQDETKLRVAKAGKRAHEARVVYEANTGTRLDVAFRLVGRTIEGKRRPVASASESRDVAAGRARESFRYPGAKQACFAYVRCTLAATATVSALAAPVPPATEPTPGEVVGRAVDGVRVGTGRPEIREHHIPYGAKRRKQMAAYSERHYGERVWRLEPRGIVQHYTGSATAGPALSTFEANRPDVEYHELPGVCAHFLIDTDGTILELVPSDVRCRHTVGLNHETIGIEHVGQSDRDVVGRPRVLRSSLALTSWLRCAYAIQRSNVIGHNESLDSPLHEELDPDFQGRTHGDMKPGTMKRYRRKLEDC